MSRGRPAPLMPLSGRARSIQVSPTVAVAARARELASQGTQVLDFSVGEPDQDTPRHVRAAAAQALEAGRTRYTPAIGIPELRAAVAERYAEDFGVGFEPGEVAATSGGKHALFTVCQVLLDRGDEVVIPAPYWPTFAEAVRLAGARPVVVRTREEDGFRLSARLVSKALTPRTRAVIVNSPSNPTGAVIAPDDLEDLARLARRRKLTLLYDDTYSHLVYEGGLTRLAGLRELAGQRLVVLGTASKSYCMTGWRIGWILGPRSLVDVCAALISHSTQCPTAFAQAGAVRALGGSQEFVTALRSEYRKRRDFIQAALARVPGLVSRPPAGSFYLFPNVSAFLGPRVPTSLALASRLLEEESVATVPGEGFDAPGYFRLSFARSMAELEEGARRIAAFLGRLGGEGRPEGGGAPEGA